MNGVTFTVVKEKDKPEYWVATKDGKVIAKAMSEQGVRSIILTMEQRQKQKAYREGK